MVVLLCMARHHPRPLHVHRLHGHASVSSPQLLPLRRPSLQVAAQQPPLVGGDVQHVRRHQLHRLDVVGFLACARTHTPFQQDQPRTLWEDWSRTQPSLQQQTGGALRYTEGLSRTRMNPGGSTAYLGTRVL